MTAKSALKATLYAILVWAVIMVLSFWNLIFHDASSVDDAVIEQMLGATRLTREQIEITAAYSDAPNFAGTYGNAFCATTASTVNIETYTLGSMLEQNTLVLSSRIEGAATFIPSTSRLRTDDYYVRVIERNADLLHYLYQPAYSQQICYVAIKR